ncbi:MAG: molybdate ABC transporter permease subunit, partial [Actinobacteria bacterium]|nr:molybdate ABC transporter permease subunit [Actinomycetota bacterium]
MTRRPPRLLRVERGARRAPIAVVGVAAITAAIFVAPLIGLVARVPWRSLLEDLTTAESLDALRLSLTCTIAAAVLSLLLGLPLAWVLARLRFPG